MSLCAVFPFSSSVFALSSFYLCSLQLICKGKGRDYGNFTALYLEHNEMSTTAN